MINGYLYFLRPAHEVEKTVYVEKVDTIHDVVRNFDTVYINNTKYRDIYHYDTIHHNELVYIRDSVHNYQFREPDYTLGISAVRLDNYKLDIHAKDTIEYTKTVYETVYKNRKNRISVGLNAGYGYGFNSKQLEPYVGVGININLFNK